MRLRIGFIGLGTMGEPIANNLRKAGHDLTVWNRTPARAGHIVSKGGHLARSARDAASGRDLVFLCLSDEKALHAVLDGPGGVLAGLLEGDVLVDMTTAGVKATRAAAEKAAGRGAKFVACPILGSPAAAEKAQVLLVAGGPPEARDRARPALHAVSSRMFEVDDPGQAALLELCVNSVGGAMLNAFAEAIALGAAGGVEASKILEVLQASTFHSPLYLLKGELILARDYAPRFAMPLAEKDQRLVQEAATELGAKVPVNEVVRRNFAAACESGRADKDWSAVGDLYLGWSGKTA